MKKEKMKIDWKDVEFLSQFMTPRGKILARRQHRKLTAYEQRLIAKAIKRARIMALLPFVRDYYL
jgi:small subunit ribosomal protein S18